VLGCKAIAMRLIMCNQNHDRIRVKIIIPHSSLRLQIKLDTFRATFK
jgi:hypothetical protein